MSGTRRSDRLSFAVRLRATVLPLLAIQLSACAVLSPVRADWPQILGPQRNGVTVDSPPLTESWPESGPPLVWEREVGEGYAGVAVQEMAVVLFHRVGDMERVERLDAETGRTVWQQDFPTDYQSGIAPDSGPRCVPTVHGDAVYVYGATGRLACLALADGRVRWQRDTRRDFTAPEGYFGAGSSPIVAAGLLLVNVGGNDAGIVAFDLSNGKTVWQATDERASYSSPVRMPSADLADVDAPVVFLTRLTLIGVDPRAGELLFRTPFGKRGPTVNGANPVITGSQILLTASYNIGATLLQLDGGQVEPVWQSDEVLSSQYTTPIVHGSTIYAIDGRQDAGQCHLRAIELQTGKPLWSQDNFGMATLLWADQKLLALTSDGQLVLVRPHRERYHELGRAQLFSSITRPLPALSNGRLYARDQRTLKCVDLTTAQ